MESFFENLWSHVTTWILQPGILLVMINYFLKMVDSHSRKVEKLTSKLWEITKKCKTLSEILDQEFHLIQKCSKSVDDVKFDYDSFSKAINSNVNKEKQNAWLTQPNVKLIVTRTLSDTVVSTRVESLKNIFAGIKYVSLTKQSKDKIPEITLSDVSMPNSIMTLSPISLDSEGSFFTF